MFVITGRCIDGDTYLSGLNVVQDTASWGNRLAMSQVFLTEGEAQAVAIAARLQQSCRDLDDKTGQITVRPLDVNAYKDSYAELMAYHDDDFAEGEDAPCPCCGA